MSIVKSAIQKNWNWFELKQRKGNSEESEHKEIKRLKLNTLFYAAITDVSTTQQPAFLQPCPSPSQPTDMSASAAPVASGLHPVSSISSYKMENNSVTPTALPNPPSSNEHINVNIIIITIIFCMVCVLLLVAFFYAFCFHCTLGPTPKDRRKDPSGSVDREDATFRRTSSSVSLGNAVWNELHHLLIRFTGPFGISVRDCIANNSNHQQPLWTCLFPSRRDIRAKLSWKTWSVVEWVTRLQIHRCCLSV